jgi:simple sugar transport system ATP-binding protein
VNTTAEASIRLEGISKAFGAVQANRDISFSIHRGAILALLGENGAGKSTLMSILAGQIQLDSGRIYLYGQPTLLGSTEQAIGYGIGMVYQHFKLVEAMTVAENVLLGQTRKFWLNRQTMQAEVGELISRYGLTVRPEAQVAELSMGEKQQVESLRLLYRQSDVLIFDEPTAVLTPVESEHLFAAMRQMRAMGKALVSISHKLEEVLAVANTVAILKRGELIDQMEVADVASPAELARRMVGRPVLLEVERQPIEPRQTVLQVKDLVGDGLHTINLELRQGKVFALVGVAGNGQKPLVETICGLRRPRGGDGSPLGAGMGRLFPDQGTIPTTQLYPGGSSGAGHLPGARSLGQLPPHHQERLLPRPLAPEESGPGQGRAATEHFRCPTSQSQRTGPAALRR